MSPRTHLTAQLLSWLVPVTALAQAQSTPTPVPAAPQVEFPGQYAGKPAEWKFPVWPSGCGRYQGAERIECLEFVAFDFGGLARFAAANAVLPAKRQGDTRVVFFGDSITDNWSNTGYGGFFPGRPYVNRGIGGQTTAQMIVRFPEDVIALEPSAVVILAGTNDISGNSGPTTLEATEANLASMAELAHAHGIKVVLASLLPVSDDKLDAQGQPRLQTRSRPPAKIAALNRWLAEYARGHEHTYLDYHTAVANADGALRSEWTGDGLHPNAAGYAVMAPLAEKAIATALAEAAPAPHVPTATEVVVLFGTQSEGPQRGFSKSYFDTATGTLSRPEFVTDAVRPGFFVVHPDGRHLYSTNSVDTFKGEKSGAVSAYEVDGKSGSLTLLNQQSSGGQNPAHVSLDAAGRHLFVANYNGGSIAVFAIKPDGSLGARTAFVQHQGASTHPTRQTQAHAHAIKLDPSGRFAFVPDLGADKLFVYRFDANTGALTPNNPPAAVITPGAGPRHISFHPNGRFAYLLNELASRVDVFAWDAKSGRLTLLQSATTLPDGFSGTTTAAEIEMHPSGKFLYTSNRGDDSLAVFAVDPATGRLTFVERVSTQGKNPRNFAFDPTGRWLVVTNHVGQNVAVFGIDANTGRLRPTGTVMAVPYPFFCVRFLSQR